MNQPQDFTAQRSKALWYAELELGFKYDGQRTIMNHRKHYGPVRVQKMLWPEKTGVCHAIIVHPPAGCRGDHLTFQISTQENAHAVVTTPGAGKWYKTNGKQAFQHIHLQVKDIRFWNGFLKKPCYLMVPMPIQKPYSSGSNCEFYWLGYVGIGRQAVLKLFKVVYANQFKLYREQKLLVADTLRFKGQDRWLSSCLGMNGYAVMGSFWAWLLNNIVQVFI
jgi:urease accessory protein